MLAARYSTDVDIIEAGIDEAGRGCLAGPVVAAAIILKPNFFCSEINDSKQISHKKRSYLEKIILENSISFGIGVVDNNEIEKINILQASILAMHRSIDVLKHKIDLLLVDGNKFNKYKTIEHKTIIKGDSKYLSIAAASILAKNYRDRLMDEYHLKYPIYNFNKNKGYPSLYHRNVISKYGFCDIHRKTFRGVRDERQSKLFI